MKNIVKSLLAMGVLFAAIGCSKDQTATEFNPGGEDAGSAYFTTKTVTEEFATTATGDQILYVDLYRQNAQGELTVGLDQSLTAESAEFYEIPESVTFKNGEFKVAIPVTIHSVENYAKGVNYTATIAVGDHHDFTESPSLASLTKQGKPSKKGAATRASEIGKKYTSISISTTLTLEWEPCYILKDPSKLLATDLTEADYVLGSDGKPMLQNGVYTYTFWWEGEDDTVMLERAAGTSVFRLTNWGGGVNIIFTINPADKSIVLTNQNTGSAYSDDTPVMVSDVPSLMGESFEEYPSTWDGERTFSFSLVYTLEDGRWFGETCTETFVLNSGSVVIEDPEPAVEIDYLGLSITPTEIKSHSLSFDPNDDAAWYYATVLKENVEDITVPDDAVDPAVAAAATEAFLNSNGVTKDNPKWDGFYATYYPQILNELKAQIYEEYLQASLAEKLPKIREEIEKGTYAGEIPVVKFTGANSEAWDLGSEGGLFTAVAFSYDKTGAYKGIDYKVFIYNPEGDAGMVQYDLYAEIEPDIASGCFSYNSICFGLQAANGDITGVKYALLPKADFEQAGLAGASDEQLKNYLAANGKSLAAADLKEVNEDGFKTYLAAKADTEYKFITAVSNADATKVEVTDIKTEAAAAPTKLACQTMVTNDYKNYYSHTHVFGVFTGTEIVSGYNLMIEASNKTLNAYISISEDGKVSLKDGVADSDMIALIEGNGDAFTSGDKDSDLAAMNGGDYTIMPFSGKPATQYVVLACATYGNGESSWTAAVQSTAFAPSVAFTQTVSANGKNIAFNWSAAPTASIFKVTKVVYALISKSALTEAGVDLSLLSDEQLNDFEARLAAGGDETAIAEQQKNADKIQAILAAEGKTFQGDAAAAINAAGGVDKQFQNVAGGDYALIALAYDKYNTKLTVGLVSVQ